MAGRKKTTNGKKKSTQSNMNGWLRLIVGVLCFYLIVVSIQDESIMKWLQTNMDVTLTQPSWRTTVPSQVNKKVKTADGLTVHFIDVGQGDSTLIEYKDFDMLIDGGDRKVTKQLLAYLDSQEIDDFEYVVGTHMDADHIGGLDDVIKKYKVDNIIDSGTKKGTKTYEYYVRAYKDKKVTYMEDSDKSIIIDEILSIRFIETGDNYREENDNSVICQVTFGNMDFLFTGDMEKEAEAESLNKFSDIEVLKVGHHGSSTSSSSSFLKRVTPEYAVISCGKKNKYGHPHQPTLDRLNRMDITTYRTDQLGTVIMTSDGNSISLINK